MQDRTNDPTNQAEARGAEGPDHSADTLAGIIARLQAQPISTAELEQIAAVLGCPTATSTPQGVDDEARPSTDPQYTHAVLARVDELLRQRPPLTVDELGQIAEAIGCTAADLLPAHVPPAAADDAAAGVAAPSLRERGEDYELWPTTLGPWHHVQSTEQMFDRGASWCAQASCHPQNQPGNYPHSDHAPADECHSRGAYLTDALDGLDGAERQVRAYAAQAFGFGEARGESTRRRSRAGTRIVLEVLDGDDEVARVSIPQGSGLLLARTLTALADLGNDVLAVRS